MALRSWSTLERQLSLELAPVADVEHQTEPVLAALGVRVGHVPVEHPALDSVVADQAVGRLERRAVREGLGLALLLIAVVGVDALEPLVARGLAGFALPAHELLARDARADRPPAAVLVPLEHVHVGVDGLQHVLELGLAGRERGRGGAARGDVRGDPDDLDGTGRELLALGALAHPARHAVDPAQPVLDAGVLAGGLRRHEHLVGGLVLGMDRGHPVLGVLVRLGAAEQVIAVRALVGLVVGAVAVEPAGVEMLLELDQQPLDRLGAQQALVLAAHVLDDADDRAVAVGCGSLAHVQRPARALHPVLHLAAAVAAHVTREPRQLDHVRRIDGGGEIARLDALAAQAPGLHELAHQSRLGQPRAIRAERGQSCRQSGQRACARRSRAGVIDEWAHQMGHRRLSASS